MVKAVTNNLEGSHNETEAKDLSIVSVSFKIIDNREAHLNKTVLNTAIIVNPIFREIKQIATEAKAMAMDLSILEDAVMEEPTISGRFNHSPKHCYKGEHDINNIMKKMSINPHQSQQSNLYQ